MWWFSLILFFYQASFIISQPLPLLLLVSFDGFRFDYPQIYGPLRNFSRLQERGVRAPSMVPTFNTASVPNHYTLITGLYEEIHGVVSDEMYDPKTDIIFQAWNSVKTEWSTVKTIWTLNEQKTGARSGVIGWPQYPISAWKYEPYKKERSFQEIVNQILGWFNDPYKAINFGAIYYPEPDLTGHETGPYSDRMRTTIRLCDEYVGYLLNEIDKYTNLKENLHVIITSDHGMEQINSTQNPMYLEDYADMTKIRTFGSETLLHIFLNSSNDMGVVFYNLSRIPHSQTFKKQDIPDRYHYKNHSRIGDLIIMVDSGYELLRRSSRDSIRANSSVTHGNHGYDNQLDSMKTIFYAYGPHFKKNFTLSNTTVLENVDIFPLMCSILNVKKCPPSNRPLVNIQQLLDDPSLVIGIIDKDPEKIQDGSVSLVIYLLVLVSFVLILIMAVVWSAVSFRNASHMARATHIDAMTIAEQNQYKFTQINDLKLNRTIGDDNL